MASQQQQQDQESNSRSAGSGAARGPNSNSLSGMIMGDSSSFPISNNWMGRTSSSGSGIAGMSNEEVMALLAGLSSPPPSLGGVGNDGAAGRSWAEGTGNVLQANLVGTAAGAASSVAGVARGGVGAGSGAVPWNHSLASSNDPIPALLRAALNSRNQSLTESSGNTSGTSCTNGSSLLMAPMRDASGSGSSPHPQFSLGAQATSREGFYQDEQQLLTDLNGHSSALGREGRTLTGLPCTPNPFYAGASAPSSAASAAASLFANSSNTASALHSSAAGTYPFISHADLIRQAFFPASSSASRLPQPSSPLGQQPQSNAGISLATTTTSEYMNHLLAQQNQQLWLSQQPPPQTGQIGESWLLQQLHRQQLRQQQQGQGQSLQPSTGDTQTMDNVLAQQLQFEQLQKQQNQLQQQNITTLLNASTVAQQQPQDEGSQKKRPRTEEEPEDKRDEGGATAKSQSVPTVIAKKKKKNKKKSNRPPSSPASSSLSVSSSSSGSNKNNKKATARSSPPSKKRRRAVTKNIRMANNQDIVPTARFDQREHAPLGIDEDYNWLSAFQCYARAEMMEVFQATESDVIVRSTSKSVKLGQVGVRCRFCAHLPHGARTNRSSAFPSRLSKLYQSFNMMIRDHFPKCPEIPKPVLEKYLALKGRNAQGACDSRHYWFFAAQKLGMFDTGGDDGGGGIFLTEASTAAGERKPPYGTSEEDKIDGGDSETIGPLVRPGVKPKISPFLHELVSHLQLVRLRSSERVGKRKTLPLGLEGFGCMYCNKVGRMGFSRCYPLRRRGVPGQVIDMAQHMQRCTLCPVDVKVKLSKLQDEQAKPGASTERSSQKSLESDTEFLDLFWSRLGRTSDLTT